MKIEIWSDIACPYCYIGKRKLEKALESFPHKDEVKLVWHSYELDANLPEKAIDESIYSYFAEKYSMSIDQARATMVKTAALAKETGLDYDFDNLVVANTSKALRLVKFANEYGLATEAEELLFKAYFTEGKDISDGDILTSLGVSIGLQEKDIIEMLASGRYKDEVANDVNYSENVLKLEYIPFYRFNDKQIIQGSVAMEDYLKVLTESYNEWKQGIVSSKEGIITGQSCSIDGVCS